MTGGGGGAGGEMLEVQDDSQTLHAIRTAERRRRSEV
jgi:hypothetical protein